MSPIQLFTKTLTLFAWLFYGKVQAQIPVDLSGLDSKSGVIAQVQGNDLALTWPTGKAQQGKVVLNLKAGQPLFKSIQLGQKGALREIAANLHPSFILTIGKRDLVSQNGWNIFFDKVPKKPFQSYAIQFDKKEARLSSVGSQTIIRVSDLRAASFEGALEITLYNGSPLFNVAAVVSTPVDSHCPSLRRGLGEQYTGLGNDCLVGYPKTIANGQAGSGSNQQKPGSKIPDGHRRK